MQLLVGKQLATVQSEHRPVAHGCSRNATEPFELEAHQFVPARRSDVSDHDCRTRSHRIQCATFKLLTPAAALTLQFTHPKLIALRTVPEGDEYSRDVQRGGGMGRFPALSWHYQSPGVFVVSQPTID